MSSGSRVLNHRQFVTYLTLFSASLALTGCNGNPNERKPAAAQGQVSGSVLNGGKPVKTDSQIIFESTEKSAMAAGKIDSLGKFSLTAADPNVGIPAGQYSVTVRPPQAEAAPSVDPSSDAYKTKMMQGGSSVAPPKSDSDIPEKFQSMATTTLKLDVKAGPNTFDIDFAKLPQ